MAEQQAALAGTSPAVRGTWLLVGSAGATGAVQAFLDAFRKPPPVGFLYAQHYDPARQQQLRQLTAVNPGFNMSLLENTRSLVQGEVFIVPPAWQLAFSAVGEVRIRRAAWRGGHTPDFNSLFLEFVRAPVPDKGVIIFSGMGDDGCSALPALAAAGITVWAQDPATAICPGLPRAALARGVVQHSGTPRALALALRDRYV